MTMPIGATILRTDVKGPADLLARLIDSAPDRGGIPTPKRDHDDLTLIFRDAYSALSFAKQIQWATQHLGRNGAARVGVGSGEIDNGFEVASHLCRVADRGQILISDAVRLLVAGPGSGELREVGHLNLPIATTPPLRTWELLWWAPEPRTKIRLCGSLTLEIDGHNLADRVPTGQIRELLGYLLANRERPIERSELVEVLWPKRPPKDPYADLRPLLSRLRRALGSERLQGKEQLWVVLPDPITVDVEEAAQAVDQARQAARRSDWEDVRGWSRRTIDLLKPGFLPSREGEWIEGQRREFEELQLEALEWVARSGIALGGTELWSAERAGREIVTRSPYRETGYRYLIEALAASGNVAEALRVYERVRRLLRDDLGVAPAADLQSLHHRLLVKGTGSDLGPANR